MNISPAHWHLLLNHFPVVLSITGVLFIIASLAVKKEYLKSGGIMILIVAAILSWPAFETGKNAEEPVEEIAGISHEAIHTHERIANNGFRIMVATGIIALITLILVNRKNKAAKIFFILTLFAGLASAIYLSYVSYTGGEIRHTEIRGEFFGD
ncbi:MAG: hypothetical protein ACHQFW_01150 [Chitinophagales bacterium]